MYLQTTGSVSSRAELTPGFHVGRLVSIEPIQILDWYLRCAAGNLRAIRPEKSFSHRSTGALRSLQDRKARSFEFLAADPGTDPRFPSSFQAMVATGSSLRVLPALSNGTSPHQGMKAGTSPAIAASPQGGYEVAFQANTGNLFTYGGAGAGDHSQGMMAGTSPSIA